MDPSRTIDSGHGDEAVLGELGSRLARERLHRNLTQHQLAAEAGVSRSTVRRLEAGRSTQLTNLVRVLRALDLLANLDAVVPRAVASPIEALELRGGERRRASSPRRGKPDRTAPPWKWGDEG